MRLFQARIHNLLALLQDTGLHKVNDNMLHKEKISSMLIMLLLNLDSSKQLTRKNIDATNIGIPMT